MDAKQEEIIRKVQKLLRLSERAGTEAEAQTAAMRVREILSEYNISLSEVVNFADEDCKESEEIIIKSKYVPRCHHMLILAVSTLFGVRSLIGNKYDTEKNSIRKTITFIGIGADSIIARQAYEFLFSFAKKRAREMRLTGKDKEDYIYGFACAVFNRACDMIKENSNIQQEQAIVPVKKGAINNYLLRKYPDMDEYTPRCITRFSSATLSGFNDGKSVSLDRPVDGESPRPVLGY